MKLRVLEYLKSPLGVFYRICFEISNAFRKEGSVQEECACQVHDEKIDKKKLSEYWELDASTTKTSVVYTCITNDYDDIKKIAVPSFVNYAWDYVCFTDNQDHIRAGHVGVWKILPLAFTKLDTTRNNRWHKFHPNLLFPNYTESLYIDANVDILTDWIFSEIIRRGAELMLPLHPYRTCIFQEYKTIMAQFMDDPKRLIAERHLIKKSGMPRNYGLTENNVFYRKHNNPIIKEIMDECWEMLVRFSKRDQLCLSWILWKHKIHINEITFPSARHDAKNFRIFKHAEPTIRKI